MSPEELPPSRRAGRLAAWRAFWATVARSAYDLGWYRHLRRHPPEKPARYFLAFHAGLVLIILLTVTPGLIGLPGDLADYVQKSFPVDSYLEVKGGRMSTNLPTGFTAGDDDLRLAVAATLAGLSAPSRPEKNWLVVGQDAVFFSDEQAGTQVKPLKEVPDFRLTREGVVAWAHQSMAWWLVFFAIAGAIMIYVWAVIVSAGLVLFYSLLARGASVIAGAPIPYWRWVGMGWYMVTAPAVAFTLLHLFGAPVPLAYTIVYMMFVLAVIADEKQDPAVSGPPPVETDVPGTGS